MTVLEGIQKSTEFLQKKGVEPARLHAELLLAHVLNLPRMKLYLNFERELTDGETDSFRDCIRRRGLREPLQHITGSISFCGFEVSVNRHVLVPRPETELLAEAGWKFLANRENPKALDFGTGSGCIAIALAGKTPTTCICAIDISAQALEVARENARRHNLTERITFVEGNGFDALPSEVPPFDLIISNPPYIPSGEIESLDPEVRDFDPRAALDGGCDGLDFYRLLASRGRTLLKDGGRLMVELGDGQASAVRTLFESQNWVVENLVEDYTQRQRILIARSR